MATKYLITGAAGFIGANFVKYLLKIHGNDAVICIIDALTYAGNLESINTELQRDNVLFHKIDIRDLQPVQAIMKDFDPDYVVNFAAESHVDRSISNPRLFLETNILGTQNMLEAARDVWHTGNDENGKPKYKAGAKYLQISTDEVYGSLHKDYDTPQPLNLSEDIGKVASGRENLKTYGKEFFTESTPLAPRSPYSASKTGADLMVQAYHATYGLPINITRCSNNYGPYHFPEKLIPLIINNILQGKRLPVYGKGENVRDWLYVEDHAKAIEMVLRKGKIGEVYNVGGFNEESNINIVKMVIDLVRRYCSENPEYAKLSALPPEKIDYSLISFVTDRPGHDMRYAIDPGKIARELGWYPETPFSEGIQKTVKWYLDNRSWVLHVTSGDYVNYYHQMYDNRQ